MYRPAGASSSARRPLVLWFHPGGEGADNGESETQLLDKAETVELSGDPARPGFVLAVVQGRNLHFPTTEARDGRHHDFYYRDLNSPSTNPDIASADKLIDDLVAEQIIDPNRIFVMGWSNGAFFGQLYTIARHDTATPGGSRVAAAAVFAAGDPFNAIDWDPFHDRPWVGPPSCQLTSYPVSSVPMLIVYRTCDRATPCGSSDQSCFQAEPGYMVSAWVNTAASRGITGIQGRLINGVERPGSDQDALTCTTLLSCDTSPCTDNPFGSGCLCLVNHLRWPDGRYPSTDAGVDRERGMLLYLESHPR